MIQERTSPVPCFSDETPTAVHVVVESPRGSLVKLKYEPALRAFKMSRPLPLGVAYPFDWGFVSRTLADDGDPLDAMVLHHAATWPGVVIPARPIAILELVQSDGSVKDQRNDRVIAVPVEDPRADLEDLAERTRRELEAFFVIAGSVTHDEVRVLGWKRRAAAMDAVNQAHQNATNDRG